jgi:hypothetical protein
MPGIIVDPRQNNDTQKRYGVALVNGNFVAYDKEENPNEFPYLPAGWKINKDNKDIDPISDSFVWEKRQIAFKIHPVESKPDSEQGPVLVALRDLLKGAASPLNGIPKDEKWK